MHQFAFHNNSMKSSAKGFTLVELLIVIAIIGLMTAILFGSTSSSRARGRDDRRVTDVKQIQLALALYLDVNRQYPSGGDASVLSVLVTDKYLPVLPVDPQTGAAYEYMTEVGSRRYCLGATLEDPTRMPSDNVTCTSKASGSTANYKVQK